MRLRGVAVLSCRRCCETKTGRLCGFNDDDDDHGVITYPTKRPGRRSIPPSDFPMGQRALNEQLETQNASARSPGKMFEVDQET